MRLAPPLPGPHIGAFGHLEGQRGPGITPPPDHRLPNGRWCFRVTQRFDDIDAYWRSQHPNATAAELEAAPRHRATDFGNHACGDSVYAMHDGRAERYGPDRYGAKAVILTAGRIRSHYWHLDDWRIPASGANVLAGSQIGILGSSGLGAICHLHVELLIDGLKVDPWPYLTGLALPDTAMEVDVLGDTAKFVQRPWRARARENARIRTDSRVREDTWDGESILSAGEEVTVVATKEGTLVNDDRTWWIFGVSGVGLRTVHASLLERLPDGAVTVDCTAVVEEAVAAARAPLLQKIADRDRRIAGIKRKTADLAADVADD